MIHIDPFLIAKAVITLGIVGGVMSVIVEKIDVILFKMCGIKDIN